MAMSFSKEALKQVEKVASEGTPEEGGAFFRRCDWWAGAVATAVTLLAYVWTLAPTVTLEDSGELAVASDYLGVPHPPGYPIWTLVTWIFQLLFHWVKYNGHPNPAWSVGLASAVAGAGACGLLALLISRSGGDMVQTSEGLRGRLGGRLEGWICGVSGVSGGLLLAFSPVLWSQSVIVEVYSLNALFQMAVVLLTYMWMCRPKRTVWLYWAAFLFGLGLTNHQTLLFLALALVLAVLVKDTDLFRDFVVAVLFVAPAFVLAWKGIGVFVDPDKLAQLQGDPNLWKWSAGPDRAAFWVYNYSFLAVPVALLTGWWTRRQPVEKRLAWGVAASLATFLLMVCLNRYFISEPMPKPEAFMKDWSPWIMGELVPAGGTSAYDLQVQSVGGTFTALCWLIVLLPVGVSLLRLPNAKTVAVAMLMAELGVAFYLYLPVASDQNPPMNWGYARTWAGFMHAVTRGQYEAIVATDVFSQKFVEQLGTYLTDLRNQFTLPITVLGFLPFCAWGIRIRGRRYGALPVALALLVLSLPLFWAEAAGANVEKVYRAMVAPVLLLAGVGVVVLLVQWLRRQTAEWLESGIVTRVIVAGFMAVLLLAVLWVDLNAFKSLFPSAGALTDAAAQGRSLVTLEDGTLAFLKSSGRLFFLGLIFAPPVAVAACWVLARSELALDMDYGANPQRWMLTSFVGFFAVSVVFLIFQNPSMDLQQQFIGRVQFIQSHAFYALWLGYGLVLSMACVTRLTDGAAAADAVPEASPEMAAAAPDGGWRPWVKGGMLAVALLLPGVLVWQNAYDEDQIRTVGGAEQNGHTYGWQFGNWGLEGIKGIREDFEYWYGGPDSDEFKAQWGALCEALGTDDPQYPPPMTQGAIFYGGTDPGRFVPTYMIYSADVRSDVYLITQNALADNTFMNVTRDLYGDTIYIPSLEESNAAFQRYVNDVQSGRIPAGADIKFENGRVSVNGVAGVMAINGILAKLIFEENKDKHDFYVEESYAIQWMYPYLTPNGIMLKLNDHPLPRLPEDVVKNDHAFWGWYVPWLLSQSEFQRDICARKSFSKLRSAIAGIYEFRRDYAEAEYAYKQSVELYPLSPEALFRLAQMYVNIGREDDAVALLSDFVEKDVHNDSAKDFLNRLTEMKAARARVEELDGRRRAGERLTFDEAIDLMKALRMTGRVGESIQLGLQLTANPSVPEEFILQMAGAFAQDQRIDAFAYALENYVRRQPRHLEAWLDLGAAYATLGQLDKTLEAVQKAYELDPAATIQNILKDPRYQPAGEDKAFADWFRSAALRVRTSPGAVPTAGFRPPAAGFPGGAAPALPAKLPGIF